VFNPGAIARASKRWRNLIDLTWPCRRTQAGDWGPRAGRPLTPGAAGGCRTAALHGAGLPVGKHPRLPCLQAGRWRLPVALPAVVPFLPMRSCCPPLLPAATLRLALEAGWRWSGRASGFVARMWWQPLSQAAFSSVPRQSLLPTVLQGELENSQPAGTVAARR